MTSMSLKYLCKEALVFKLRSISQSLGKHWFFPVTVQWSFLDVNFFFKERIIVAGLCMVLSTTSCNLNLFQEEWATIQRRKQEQGLLKMLFSQEKMYVCHHQLWANILMKLDMKYQVSQCTCWEKEKTKHNSSRKKWYCDWDKASLLCDLQAMNEDLARVLMAI